MIRDALIFMCGAWAGVILGMVLVGFAHSSRRADDAERSELDNDQTPRPPQDPGIRLW